MKRRIQNHLIFIFVTIILLSACIPVSQTPVTTAANATLAPGTKPVTITIWHQWNKDTLNAMQAILDQYMAEHPTLSIVLVQPENVQDALKVAIPAGKGPDIIDWTNDQIGSQAQVGNIRDLDTAGISEDFLTSTYETAAANGVIWNGKIWGLPENQSGIALIYNRALASEADFPTDPLDFEGLLFRAKAYHTANPGKYLVCNQGLGTSEAYYVAPIYFGFGMPGYIDEAGNAYLNTTEGIAAGKWIKEFKPYAPSQATEEICTRLFTQGLVAAEWTGPWAIAGIKEAGIDYGILPMGRPFVGTRILMIGKNVVEHGTTALAVDIIKYLTNPENQIQLALASQIVPANSVALSDSHIQTLPTVNSFGTAFRTGIPMVNTPYAASQWGPVGDATLAIWMGTQDVEEALAAGQAAIENAISGMK